MRPFVSLLAFATVAWPIAQAAPVDRHAAAQGLVRFLTDHFNNSSECIRRAERNGSVGLYSVSVFLDQDSFAIVIEQAPGAPSLVRECIATEIRTMQIAAANIYDTAPPGAKFVGSKQVAVGKLGPLPDATRLADGLSDTELRQASHLERTGPGCYSLPIAQNAEATLEAWLTSTSAALDSKHTQRTTQASVARYLALPDLELEIHRKAGARKMTSDSERATRGVEVCARRLAAPEWLARVAVVLDEVLPGMIIHTLTPKRAAADH